mmetsp:Transcript_20195/g.23113  ORF Transcript_20195/g.23113 Transcript_20195/m.23113 type:complete len:310 (+) Transcript_20195:136-1065(+)
MGNTQPHNKTGRKVVEQKLENAKKTGILSLCEHKLEIVPTNVFEISKLTTLDLSTNKITMLNPKISNLKVLKSLNVDNNKLTPGSLEAIGTLSKLKTLSVNNNLLGRPNNTNNKNNNNNNNNNKFKKGYEALPTTLPKNLKTLLLSNNLFSNIPRSILQCGNDDGCVQLKLLEKLDLSSNNVATVPENIANLPALNELNLDNNVIVSLPSTIGKLSKLKVLSLRNNHLSVSENHNTNTNNSTTTNPQPLPRQLWVDTLIIDINLHGNPMTNTQLNTMDGYDIFLERRRDIKNKDILGGAMTDLEGCGLK